MFAFQSAVTKKNVLNEFFKLYNFGGKINIIKNKTKQMSGIENQNRKMSIFKFIDYDCIGFDLDNTVARYKIGAMIEMEYNVMADYLIKNKGYSKKHLSKPFDPNFILRGLIVDDENGNLLRIAPDGYILQATHGTKMLNGEQIEQYYKNRHWEPADLFAKDPLVTWNGPYSEKMRTILDYFDIATSLIFARAIDSIDEEKGRPQEKYFVWPDLQEVLQNMFHKEHYQSDKGNYFPNMKATPEKYYYKCSHSLLNWLKILKNRGILLFLLTGSNTDFVSLTASNTIGSNWRDYFDITICFAKKPGFFTMKRDFIALDGFKEIGPIKANDLKLGEIYSYGNWTDLHDFLRKHINKPNPKFLYIGDNLIQDIYTPNVHSQCETVAVCEELEAEGVDGHKEWHPDKQMLASTIWGSYFHCRDTNKITNWYHIMKKHSKVCAPSLEYVASLPIDHEYQCNESQ